MVKAKKYVVKNHFKGTPKKCDFEVVEQELPPLKDREILLKTEWISVDHYLYVFNAYDSVPRDQGSFQVALVIESKHPDYPLGSRVVSHEGWRDYTIVNPDLVVTKTGDLRDTFYKLPDLINFSPSLAIGALGTTGPTAYFGFLEICKPKAGDTVVVTGAAGAVGSIVGQIAKIKGCKVIGFAGSDLKVQWLEKKLGFDKAFNYKTVNVLKALQEVAPNGIDCYFDNVGGEISSTILSQMKVHGNVSVCGYMSSYNQDMPKATIVQPLFVSKQLNMHGFVAWRWEERWDEAITELVKWIKSGQLIAEEHVTEGFDKLYDAFVGMLDGENFGKAVVKV